MLCLGGFVVIHQNLLNSLTCAFIKAFSGEFAANSLNGYICADQVLVDIYSPYKTKGKRILVYTNKDLIALAYSNGLFVGIDDDGPRSQHICGITVSNKAASEDE